MSGDDVNKSRRRLLVATSVVGGVGTAFAVVPFVKSMLPSARAKTAGAPVEADFSKLEPGQQMTVQWRGKPVWLIDRTAENLADLPGLDSQLADPDSAVTTQQPTYCVNGHRSIKPNLLVVVGICTHLGCSPTYRPEVAPADLGPEWKGGFFCPCHGSRYDLAGRVYSGVPAPTNLEVPPYTFVGQTGIMIGEDPTASQLKSLGLAVNSSADKTEGVA